MAQTLEEFERLIQPLVPKEKADEFKAIVRRKVNALATDAADLFDLESEAIVQNGIAQDIRDRLHADPPIRSTSGGS